MQYLSSCSIVKNEDPYIWEFYCIHKHLGVESFLFFDRSTEGRPLTEIFKNCNDVKIIHYPEPNRHAQAWRDGVAHFKGKSRWVQFIDIDQVTVPLKTNDIKVMLQDYEHAASFGLNWHTFGSNHKTNEPTAGISTYEAYTKRAVNTEPINNHIQSIVQVEHAQVNTWANPHFPPLNGGHIQCNENKSVFTGPFSIPPTQNIGFIAHYYTRSKEYWAKKLAKLRADTGTSYGSFDDFNNYQNILNVVEDETVKNIWNRCKK
jgi:hypothetical protein